jgi:cell division protein FtsB
LAPVEQSTGDFLVFGRDVATELANLRAEIRGARETLSELKTEAKRIREDIYALRNGSAFRKDLEPTDPLYRP